MIQLYLVREFQYSDWLMSWFLFVTVSLAVVLTSVKVVERVVSREQVESLDRFGLVPPFLLFLVLPWMVFWVLVVSEWGSYIYIIHDMASGLGLISWKLSVTLAFLLALFVPLAGGLIYISMSYPDKLRSYVVGAVIYAVLVATYYAVSSYLRYLSGSFPPENSQPERLIFLILFAGLFWYYLREPIRDGDREQMGYTVLMYSPLLVISVFLVLDVFTRIYG